MNKKGYQKYKATAVQSASKEKILLMLYEGAIKFVKLAMIAIDNKDIAERGLNIGRAFDIVMELNNTLNHEVGGDVAVNLEQLYYFIMEELTQANISADKKRLENVLKILTTLLAGWQEAIEKLKKQENQTA
ncbi:MAG: flagellar export chaperone FliS [Bdellovibrionales bacterium]|nr:flagellar export chaperone FliS [Bdellovibrionales bacterium]